MPLLSMTSWTNASSAGTAHVNLWPDQVSSSAGARHIGIDAFRASQIADIRADVRSVLAEWLASDRRAAPFDTDDLDALGKMEAWLAAGAVAAGEPIPTSAAARLAFAVLQRLAGIADEIRHSHKADGGVIIEARSGSRFADVDIFNDSDVFVTTGGRGLVPAVAAAGSSEAIAKQVTQHLCG